MFTSIAAASEPLLHPGARDFSTSNLDVDPHFCAALISVSIRV